MILEKYSLGHGDRFGRQGRAQLDAVIKARKAGVEIAPVWNKSHREHQIIHSQPADVRREADAAVAARDWSGGYYVDADHINLGNVGGFLESSDFFTLDVADAIGQAPAEDELREFVAANKKYVGQLSIPGIDEPLEITPALLEECGRKFLAAMQEAAAIYRRLEAAKGAGNFITEVSVDEAAAPQTPVEMFFVLAMIAAAGIPAQTIAPKFTGRFNKGVDYVGDGAQFTREFEADLAVIRFAVKEFSLPANLKLSVHSGSDKFAIYGPIHAAIKKFDAGLHLKTAGTTWLEELIGLALAGGGGLDLAREVYAQAFARFDELAGPYAAVIDIDRSKLPAPDAVAKWDGAAFAAALRHDQKCAGYNPHLRQLLHIGYKIAAEMGARFLNALEEHEEIIARNVTENLFERHIRPVFVGG